MIYEHTQPGYVLVGVLGAGAILSLGLVFFLGAPRFWIRSLCYVLSASLLVGTFLFSSLTVEVTSQHFRFSFGPGFWERQIPLRKIADVRTVRNPIYYGWGIRYTPYGWLYTVSGLRAVELEMQDGTTLRVGTDEPQRLRRALKQVLASQ
jgi:hypothetical protein